MNGSGGAVLDSSDGLGFLATLGVVTDAFYTFSVTPGASDYRLLGRTTADGKNAYLIEYQYSQNKLLIVAFTGGSNYTVLTNIPGPPTPTASIAIGLAGSTISALVDGNVLGSVTNTAITADGFLGFGGTNATFKGITRQTQAEVTAAAAAAALAAAQAKIGTPTGAGVYGEATPADNLPRGIYGPANVNFVSYLPGGNNLASYFVRGMAGVTRMTITGTDAASVYAGSGGILYASKPYGGQAGGGPNGLTYDAAPGTVFHVNIGFDNSLSGGTDSLTLPVTLTCIDGSSALAATGGRFWCDGQAGSVFNDVTCLNGIKPGDNGGAPWTIIGADANLFQYTYFGLQISAAASPLSAHYGKHTLQFSDGSKTSIAEDFYLLGPQSPRAKIIPATTYDTAQPGDVIFQVAASSDLGGFTYALIGPVASQVVLSVDGTATLGGTVSLAGLAGTNLTGVCTVTSNGSTAYIPVSIPVAAGQLLAANAMTVAVAANLNNGTLGQVATFVPPASMGSGITYSLLQRPRSIDNVLNRYAIDGTAHTITNTALLSASPEPVSLVARKNGAVAITPFIVSAAAAVGPVFEAGPGQTYPLYANATAALCEDVLGGTNAYGAGATIHLHVKPGRRDWYGELSGNTTVYDRRHQMAYGGYAKPYNIVGVPDPATGAFPTVGGADGYFGKGSILLTQNRDVGVSNLEIENCVVGASNVRGIKDDNTRQGNTVLSNLYIHNCHNGYLGGQAGKLTVNNVLVSMCGTGAVGTTHNWYQQPLEMEGHHILSHAASGAHVWKDRAVTASYYDSVFSEGMIGRGSAVIDMPNAGNRAFYRCVFIKGPMANNTGCLQYSRETQLGIPSDYPDGMSYPGGDVYFEDCIWISFYPLCYGSGGSQAVWMTDAVGRPVIDPATGLQVRATFVRCSQFGFQPNRFLVQGGNDNGGTTFPPEVTTLAEPPPLDYRSPLLNGAPVRSPSPWLHPNPQSYTVFSCNCEPGIIDPGVHELRVNPAATVGTPIGVPLKAWGWMDVQSSDPNFDPWGSNATWAENAGGVGINPYFGVSASGQLYVKQSLAGAQVLSWIHVEVTSTTVPGRKTDAILPIVVSTTPARTDCIPAALGPRVLAPGQEGLA